MTRPLFLRVLEADQLSTWDSDGQSWRDGGAETEATLAVAVETATVATTPTVVTLALSFPTVTLNVYGSEAARREIRWKWDHWVFPEDLDTGSAKAILEAFVREVNQDGEIPL